MELPTKTEREFWLIKHTSYPDCKTNQRLVQESSAIGEHENSVEKPGSSFLWISDNFHLNREEIAEFIQHLARWLRTGSLKLNMCGRCYDEVDELFPPNCDEKPEDLLGQPIGQYHCPDCGAMVIAGIKHPELCQKCINRQHPGFDKKDD